MSTLKQKLDENLLQDKHIRSLLIDRLTKIKKNKQKFRTPDIILAKMTAKTDLSNKMVTNLNMTLVFVTALIEIKARN